MKAKASRIVALLLLALLIASCASNPSISSLSPEERAKVSQIVLVPSGAIHRESYQRLGTVKGFDCDRSPYGVGTVSMETAHQGVRIRAAQLGADAVTNLLCESASVDWARNCWDNITCVADAISVADKSLLSGFRGGWQGLQPGTVSRGTAWVAGPNLIATNNHVVAGAREITGYLRDGRAIVLKMTTADPVNDLALIRES
jgi:S1-C subfamily serine protease